MGELFTDQEIVQFNRADEVRSLIRTWLSDPAGRRRIADAARQRVLREHTYQHRMTHMLAELGLRQPDRLGSILRGERNAAALAGQASASPELATWCFLL